MRLVTEITADLPPEVKKVLDFPEAQAAGANVEQVAEKVKEAFQKAKERQATIAKYKIELHFGRKRSSTPSVANAGCILIWESGRRLHGGGDEKMYWCGYKDCGKPMSSDNFGYMHTVCPTCKRELFLDPEGKKEHVDYLKNAHQPLNNIERLPFVVGERLFRLSNEKVADLLVKTYHELGDCADIYVKYHPLDVRYDPVHASVDAADKLTNVRIRRVPLIYTWKNVLHDTLAGADLHQRFVAMLRA